MANQAFSAIFFKFIHQYILESHDISTLAHVNTQIAMHISKNKVPSSLDQFRFETEPHKAYKMVKNAIKNSETQRLQKLQQETQMVVLE